MASMQAIVLSFFITVTLGALQLEKIEYRANEKLGNLSISYRNTETGSLVFNITVEIKAVFRKFIGYLKVMLAESPEDQVLKKEYLRMTIDHEKLFNGVAGNFVLRVFMENFKAAIDSNLTFPLKKGIYKLVNFELSDKLVPFPMKTRASIECRYLVKVDGKKSFEHLYTWKATGSITKGIL